MAVQSELNNERRSFETGGYYILGERLGQGSELRCIVDCGSLGFQSIAAHGHADALSFVLSVAGYQILIDPGTYAYHTDGKWRSYFRGTSAHNTVVVDGLDQSVMGGHFMWLKHAKSKCMVWEEDTKSQIFRGRHDGYLRLDDPVCHMREVRYTEGERVFMVEDVLECNGHHIVEHFWHFHPRCTVETDNSRRLYISCGPVRIRMRSLDEGSLDVRYFNGSDDPISGWYSPKFGQKCPTTSVRWRREVSETSTFRTAIEVISTD